MSAKYRHRSPQKTNFYKIIDKHYYSFKADYNSNYAEKYGFFRPEIENEINIIKDLDGEKMVKSKEPENEVKGVW